MDYRTTTQRIMRDTILSALLLFSSLNISAINPQREYSVPVENRGKNFEELQVETSDGFKINVWHLPSDNGIPLIISESDAGNMGDWVHLGRFLQLYGIDVWLYDYRGFGASSDFPIERNQLFYQEFVTDLSAVADYVYCRTGKAPYLMGISMGSLIVDEFLKETDIPINTLIFDGYVGDPNQWVKRLKELKGKTVTIPDGYEYSVPKRHNIRSLYITATEDNFSLPEEIPDREAKNTHIKTFDCGHIMALWDHTMDYVKAIADFINSTGEYMVTSTSSVTERTDTLKAAMFTERSVKHFSDHQKFYLNKEDRNAHATALETLKLIPGILIKDDEATLLNGKGLTILLNGLPTTSASLSLLTPADIKSIDFYQNAPARYSFAGSGSMVNIITRRPGIGGNLMLNLKDAVTTPWGNNAVSYRQVLKNTMIGIEYSGKPSKSGGYGIDEFLEYEAGGNLYTKEKKGLDTDFTRNQHNVSLDLVRMKDENSALKAQFTLVYEKKDWPISQSALKTVTNLTTQESTTSEVTDHKDDWSEYLSPALDIYWNRRFSDRHELSVNFVATAYDTKSRKGFYEYAGATPLLSSTSLTDGRKYSGIIEAVYGWTLSEKHKLGFGARSTASLAEQNSGNGEVTVRSDINTDLGRLWCEYSGNARGFSYSVGAAMEHFGYKTNAAGRHDYIYFRPLVQLNYIFNDHSSMYFNYSSNTSTPKIGWLGDASYYKDDKWLVRSNPELESYTTRDAMIGYSFNNSWLYINPYILVYHNDNQIIPIFSHTDGLLVEMDENSGNMLAVMAALGSRIKPFRNIPLSLTVYAMYNDQRLTGGGADRSVKSLGGMAMLRYSGKKWTAEAMYNQPFKSISDIGISKGENYGYFEFARRIGKNLRIGAGMRYPFYHWKVSEETAPGSPVTMKNTSRMTSQKNTVILTCVYNFSYGKEVRAVSKKINNFDSDSGLF